MAESPSPSARPLCFTAILLLLLLPIVIPACQQAPAAREAPLRGAPAITLFTEPTAGARPIIALIQGAHRSIDLSMYLLTQHTIVQSLIEAKRRGVAVRVMLEENPYGSGTGNATAQRTLQQGRVAVKGSNPAVRLSHQKFMVVDHSAALIMTANLTQSAVTNNREFLVEDHESTDVDQIERIFEADWNRQSFQSTDPRVVISPINARADLTSLIDSAHQSISLESEEMQDRGIENALARAVRRQVRVHVVLSPGFPGRRDANARGERTVASAGGRVRLLREPYIHAKAVVVDGQSAFVGSENISTASLDDNREVGLLISDPAAIHSISSTIEADWKAGHTFQ